MKTITRYFGAVHGKANQYSGDMASGFDSYLREFNSPEEYYAKYERSRINVLYEVKYEERELHILSCKNLFSGECVYTYSKIPTVIHSLISQPQCSR